MKLLYDWDWQGAEREFKYDSQMNPDSLDTFSCYLHSADTLGRTNEAVAKLTRLLTIDPMSPLYNLELGCVAYYARQYDTTISQYWRTVALDPGLIIAYANVGRAYAQKQMYEEAIRTGEGAQAGFRFADARVGTGLCIGCFRKKAGSTNHTE